MRDHILDFRAFVSVMLTLAAVSGGCASSASVKFNYEPDMVSGVGNVRIEASAEWKRLTTQPTLAAIYVRRSVLADAAIEMDGTNRLLTADSTGWPC